MMAKSKVRHINQALQKSLGLTGHVWACISKDVDRLAIFRVRVITLIAFTAVPFVADRAVASSSPGSMTISASVTASCAVNSASTVAFGTVTAGSLPIQATGSITFTCTNGTTWSLYSNSGANPSGSQTRMKNGTNFIPYDLYRDAAYTTYFPNSAANAMSGTGTGTVQSLNLYGIINTGITIPLPGNYSDTIAVTINF